MTLQSEADELYGMLPDEFTAHRNAQAKSVRAAGDRELADRIRKLPKPRMTAWVLNMLVRRLPDEVDELVDLGARLREAQASLDGDNVRALNDQRRQVTASLTRQARTISADLGHQVGDEQAAEVENTLRAAMADPAGGAALRTGLLVDSFGSTGFEPVEIERVVAVPDAVVVPPPVSPHRPRLEVVRQPAATPTTRTERPRKRPAVPKERPAPPAKKRPVPPAKKRPEPPTKRPAPDTRARVQAQQALQDARDALDRAIGALTEATQSHGDATEHREELETERSTVQERLRTLDRELARAHRAEDKAERGQERAEREVARAKRTAERAQRRVERPADGETVSSE